MVYKRISITKNEDELYLSFSSVHTILSQIKVINFRNIILNFEIKDIPLLQNETFLGKIFLNKFKRYSKFYRVDNKGRISIWFLTSIPAGNIPFIRSVSPENYFKHFFSQELKLSDKGVLSNLLITNAKVHYKTLLEKLFLSKFKWVIPSYLIKANEKERHYSFYFPNKETIKVIRSSNLGLIVKEKEKVIFSLQDFEKLSLYIGCQDENYKEQILKLIKTYPHLFVAPKNEELENFIDFLIENNVLEEGILLKCSYCAQSWFYTFSEFDEDNQFKCIYCRKKQKLKLSNHRKKTPIIFFSLADYVYKLFNKNGDLPLITLLWLLKSENFSSLIWANELKHREEFEVDLIAVANGKLILAECKKTDDNFKEISKDFLDSNLKKAIDFFEPSVIFLSSFDEKTTNMKKVAKEIRNFYPEKNIKILIKHDFEKLTSF